MTSEILKKSIEKKIEKSFTVRSCAFPFKIGTIRCHSARAQTTRAELMKLVDAFCAEITAAVNVLEHPKHMQSNYVKSCTHTFNAGWSADSDIEIFFIRNDKIQIALSRQIMRPRSFLMVFLRDNNLNSIFIDINDTLATDRIWSLANQFPKK